MFSRTDTVNAFLGFYKELVKQPGMQTSFLNEAPQPGGWDSVNVQALMDLGKNDTVIDLLQHLPYLFADDRDPEDILIDWETFTMCYMDPDLNHLMEKVTPLPAHCAYLTRGRGREGYCFIIDTEQSTITEYSIIGYKQDYELADQFPPELEWKSHKTMLIQDFWATWTSNYAKLVWMIGPTHQRDIMGGMQVYCRADNMLEEAELREQGLQDIHFEDDEQFDTTDLSVLDANEHQRKLAQMVFRTILRHGWLDNFDKENCRVELSELWLRDDAHANRIQKLSARPPKLMLATDEEEAQCQV
ncbi:hypothetical protein K461DRAFT_104284 [Myriangium duriaei CBS 260.36]|uniref:Uncharacterized protein n=1 Tax=Myriangium duriaei CBS 260.36 TaxID=1168546 RepID=A0A9P4MJ41_9PEZI|nr:hypothetical protein K461DRAFT_104284 [Myriangium duriaei CBS 260.36]